MIQEKYIELMNGELDGANSPDTSRELHSYLAENPEARIYYQELREAVRIFAKVEPLEPPPGLRDDILATVDHSMATSQAAGHATAEGSVDERIGLVPAIIEGFRFRMRPSHNYAFAAGLLVGLMLFAAIWRLNPGSGAGDIDQLYGTIISQVESGHGTMGELIPIDLPGIVGSAQAYYAEDKVLIRLGLSSDRPVQILFQYDERMACEGFRAGNPGSCDFSVTGKQTELNHRGEGEYDIVLQHAQLIQSQIHMQILTDGAVLSDQTIEPRRD